MYQGPNISNHSLSTIMIPEAIKRKKEGTQGINQTCHRKEKRKHKNEASIKI